MIYFDNSATTKICKEALDRYCEVSVGCFANPSSLHSLGFAAEGEIKRAKEVILSTLSARESEVIFCASGSEANNLAIMGRAFAKERYKRTGKIVTTLGEHASVNEPVEKLRALGYRVCYLPTRGGEVDREALERELTPDVILVSMMMVNNETGALYDVRCVGEAMRRKCPEALLHVDCTQSYLKVPYTKAGLGADLMTLSAHKIEGPKGVGALVADKRVLKNRGLCPIILGGGQEGGMRSGTENVGGICAFAEAAKIGYAELAKRQEKMSALRAYLIEKLRTGMGVDDIYITEPRVHAPHILNITVYGIKSETMLHFLSSKGIYVSSGSACSSNTHHESGALLAYGHTPAMADCSIRVSLSHRNEYDECDEFVAALKEGISKLARIRK